MMSFITRTNSIISKTKHLSPLLPRRTLDHGQSPNPLSRSSPASLDRGEPEEDKERLIPVNHSYPFSETTSSSSPSPSGSVVSVYPRLASSPLSIENPKLSPLAQSFIEIAGLDAKLLKGHLIMDIRKEDLGKIPQALKDLSRIKGVQDFPKNLEELSLQINTQYILLSKQQIPYEPYSSNPKFDRYPDHVQPHKKWRIELPGKTENYINATPLLIQGIKNNSLKIPTILTQGPKEEWMPIFCKMIEYYQPGVVVCLTNPYETETVGKEVFHIEKCSDYFLHKNSTYRNYQLKRQSSLPRCTGKGPKIIKQSFQLLKDKKIIVEFNHFWVMNWIDNQGIDPKILLQLALTIIKIYKQIKIKRPLVIHCSAGVGRTGTLALMLLCLMDLLEKQETCPLENLFYLRSLRGKLMVRNQIQIQMVYVAIQLFLQNKKDHNLKLVKSD